MAHRPARSKRSWRSRTPQPPRITWRKSIYGTAAIFYSTPRRCSPRSSASNRPWPKPRRRRSTASSAISTSCARRARRALPRPKLPARVPTDLGWSDIGSWSSVWDVLDHDAAGNATDGPVVMLDSRNSLVHSEESVLTTVIGLEDVIVVSTADAVLVSARTKAEQGKELVEQLT